MMKKGLIVAAFCAILIGVGLFLTHDQSQTHATSNKAVFTGVDLSCQDCQKRVETALSKILGIKEYQLNPDNNTVTVMFNHEVMQPRWIEQSLKAAGFNPKDFDS